LDLFVGKRCFGQNVIGRSIHICYGDEDDFISILEKLMERLDDEDLEVVAMIARKNWLRRNTVVHIGDLLHSSNIVS